MSLSKRIGVGYGRRPLLVIEHLESTVSRWLWAEYRHAASIAGKRLVFTNASPELCAMVRAELGLECFRESIVELEGVLYESQDRVIVLDPQAGDELTPDDTRRADVIVVGGILGDHPPRGRTKALLSSRLPHALKRHIGERQFSIDGAVYMALQVASGRSLREIPVVYGYRLSVEWGYGLSFEVELPYAYPVVDGRPLVAPELPELLARGLAYEEYRLAKRERG